MPVAFLPLIAATAAATAPVPPAEDRALFAAFKGVCSKVRKLDAMAAAARRGGWQAVEPDANPNLELLVTKGLGETRRMEPNASFAGSQYHRKVAGRDLWLVLSRYADKDGYWANGCRIYHFEAATALPVEELTVLMGKSPTGSVPMPDNQVKHLWEPGWKSGHTVEVSFVTGNDPVSQRFGLKGQVLVAQAIGGF